MKITRRSILTHSAVATLVPAAADSSPDWIAVRRQFALRSDIIYMNAANIAPAPEMVWHEYQRQLADFQSNPAFQNREVYKTLAEQVRRRLASYLHAQPAEIAITRNTSESNNVIAQGLRLKPGDEILITSENHPSNTASWKLRAQQQGATVVVAAAPLAARTPTEVFDSVAAKVTPRTRVIAVSHFTNTTGLLYPVRLLAELARRRNAWLHVDGAQAFGWMNLDLAALGMDSFSGSFHKWPMGPLENGILYVRQARLEEVSPAILSVDYWSDAPEAARKFETLGQRDDPRLKAVDRTIEFLESLGAARIESRVLEIAAMLRNALSSVGGAEPRGSGERDVSGPVIKVHFPRHDLTKLYSLLWNKHRLAIAKTDSGPSAGLRFSPHVYNTSDEIDQVVRALKAA